MIRSILSVGGWTLVSRVTGFARDVADNAGSYARDAYDRGGSYLREGREAVGSRVEENPLIALVLAGAVGYGLALLLHGRR